MITDHDDAADPVVRELERLRRSNLALRDELRAVRAELDAQRRDWAAAYGLLRLLAERTAPSS